MRQLLPLIISGVASSTSVSSSLDNRRNCDFSEFLILNMYPSEEASSEDRNTSNSWFALTVNRTVSSYSGTAVDLLVAGTEIKSHNFPVKTDLQFFVDQRCTDKRACVTLIGERVPNFSVFYLYYNNSITNLSERRRLFC